MRQYERNIMKKVVGIGDLLVSLSPEGYLRFIQSDVFRVFFTGAEANVCASLCQLGIPCEFVTRLPENDISKAAVANLRKYNVSVDNIAFGGERIGVIYTEKGASQRPSKVIYDRKHTAICEASPDDFDWDRIFQDAQWLHFTGITPALSATTPAVCKRACIEAKKRDLTISCDLNYRKKLWTPEEAGAVMSELLQYVDVLIANEEDAEKVLGIKAAKSDVDKGILDAEEYADTARRISERFHIPYVATTLRESLSASDNGWSAMLYHDGVVSYSKKYNIHIVNRVGGGDSFSAGLIYGLIHAMSDQDALEFAAAASCLKHSIENDFNVIYPDEVYTLMQGNGSGRVQR